MEGQNWGHGVRICHLWRCPGSDICKFGRLSSLFGRIWENLDAKPIERNQTACAQGDTKKLGEHLEKIFHEVSVVDAKFQPVGSWGRCWFDTYMDVIYTYEKSTFQESETITIEEFVSLLEPTTWGNK
eukprot:623092-Amorphochlora_amoeboformis.AAC.2